MPWNYCFALQIYGSRYVLLNKYIHFDSYSSSTQQHTEAQELDNVQALLKDTFRALQKYDPVLKTHALHTYHSMLASIPECELLRVYSRGEDGIRLISWVECSTSHHDGPCGRGDLCLFLA
jgi:nitrate reductase beta subunit